MASLVPSRLLSQLLREMFLVMKRSAFSVSMALDAVDRGGSEARADKKNPSCIIIASKISLQNMPPQSRFSSLRKKNPRDCQRGLNSRWKSYHRKGKEDDKARENNPETQKKHSGKPRGRYSASLYLGEESELGVEPRSFTPFNPLPPTVPSSG